MKTKIKDIIDVHLRFRKIYFFVFTSVLIIILILISSLSVYRSYHPNVVNRLIHGNEAENSQKVIPTDVLGRIKNETTPLQTFRIPILMYHYVEYVQNKNDKIRMSLDILPTTLESQIKTLADAGYTFLTAGELADILDGAARIPIKPILLTFDDGYRDFYSDAFPILKKYNVKATAYIVYGFLNFPNYLTKEQVSEIIKSGLVEIGAHTLHHAWLKGKPLKYVSLEIFQNRFILEQEFRIPIVSFAYPYGAFDSQAVDIVKAAGYKSAVSTVPGIEQSQTNRFFLYRIRPGARTGQFLLNFLTEQKTAIKQSSKI